jgi:hypothetical protein
MIVNGFNIDDPDEASEYLKSQGVDVDALVKRGLQKISEIQRNKALSMSGVSDLLPCPFCGSEAQIVKLDYTYSTMCSNSECDVCPEAEAQTRQESIVSWNKRQ